MSDNLQDGIFFRSGERPGRCWRLLLLNFTADATPESARAAIADVWAMLARLRDGLVDDLNPVAPRGDDPTPVKVPHGDLTCLIGYGARLFNARAHPLPLVRTAPRPPMLTAFETEGVAKPFAALNWAPPADRRQQDADVILQFIADTELAVNRAIVETAKIIADKALPLRLVTFFEGFNRDDHRSWIDFHDAINTIKSEHRLKVIEFLHDEDIPWLLGGTFLAFLRCEVALEAWRRLTREEQELLVGRDKLTGCPLIDVTSQPDGSLLGQKMAGCPMSGNVPNPPIDAYIDPQRPSHSDTVLRASHIHRANLNRGEDPRTESANRFYRQGYEFLECRPDGRLSLGLNFVSFQDRLERIRQVLQHPEWLGGANFGGISPGPRILSLVAGGFYAVPPKAEPFPGVALFD